MAPGRNREDPGLGRRLPGSVFRPGFRLDVDGHVRNCSSDARRDSWPGIHQHGRGYRAQASIPGSGRQARHDRVASPGVDPDAADPGSEFAGAYFAAARCRDRTDRRGDRLDRDPGCPAPAGHREAPASYRVLSGAGQSPGAGRGAAKDPAGGNRGQPRGDRTHQGDQEDPPPDRRRDPGRVDRRRASDAPSSWPGCRRSRRFMSWRTPTATKSARNRRAL